MNTVDPNRDPQRMKKTIQSAQVAAFTTQLFYFTMKILFTFILYKYNSTLRKSWLYIIGYVIVLIVNTYLILTAGKNPGFEVGIQQNILAGQESQSGELIQNQTNYCDICNCHKKIRTKHCFRCGKCVRKYDHHCPWIGTCVGQANQFLFCIFTFTQTVQSIICFVVCFTSMQMYEYKQSEDVYSPQFGVFAIFSLFMFMYILFVGGLFCFHSYLILVNSTTNQLMSRSKVKYLDGIKGNPFSRGLFKNIQLAINIPQQGHEWTINTNQMIAIQKHWTSKICKNQYYDCC